jgi:hypothetical protein
MPLVLSIAAPAYAHDLERTQVSIAFVRDGSFVLDVSNDPNWLKLRLEAFTGPFSDRVVLWVDGHEIRPESVEYIPGRQLATYRMRGRLPAAAHTLRWYYGLVIDPYPLVVHRADGRLVVEEVEGDAWSRTIDVSSQFQAPRAADKLAPILLLGLLSVPIALRLITARSNATTKTRRHEKH